MANVADQLKVIGMADTFLNCKKTGTSFVSKFLKYFTNTKVGMMRWVDGRLVGVT